MKFAVLFSFCALVFGANAIACDDCPKHGRVEIREQPVAVNVTYEPSVRYTRVYNTSYDNCNSCYRYDFETPVACGYNRCYYQFETCDTKLKATCKYVYRKDKTF